jgi:hypothetical protein
VPEAYFGLYGREAGRIGMPGKIMQLTVRDGKVVAYDDQSKRLFLVKLEPLDLNALEKDELAEVVKFALCGGEPDAVI